MDSLHYCQKIRKRFNGVGNIWLYICNYTLMLSSVGLEILICWSEFP